MEIKSHTSTRIKIGALLVFIGLIILELFFGPPTVFNYIPKWLILTTVVFLFLGYFLVLVRPTIKDKKDSEKINNMYLMTYGQKIPVDLNKCIVTENLAKTESILVYEYFADNKSETFNTQSLPYDKNSLFSKLRDKKETFLYVDNKDRTKYFFDIDFIQH